MSTKSVEKKVEAKENPKSAVPKKEASRPVTGADLLNKPEIKAEIARQEKLIGEKLRETITEELTLSYRDKISAIETRAQAQIAEKIKELEQKNSAQLEEQKKFVLEKNAEGLIEILDHFNIAVEHIEKNKDLVNYASGFKMILQLFNRWLLSIGVEQIAINPGDPFNLTTMSVFEKVDSNLPVDCVVKVVRKGYKINDKVIRFAGVSVSNAKFSTKSMTTPTHSVRIEKPSAPTSLIKPTFKHPAPPNAQHHSIKKPDGKK